MTHDNATTKAPSQLERGINAPSRDHTNESADLVQGDAKLRENSGDADATENHVDGGQQ